MPDYSKGKIYKLVGGGLNYYGSTVNELRYRLKQHKYDFKNRNKTSKLLFETGDDVKIYLVEKYPCADRMELNARERWYIENNECVNKVVPIRTIIEKKKYQKKFREEHKEDAKIYHKDYVEINRDSILKYRKEYYENNKERIKERTKKYQLLHNEAIKERNKAYFQAHKDEINERKKAYRARIKAMKILNQDD